MIKLTALLVALSLCPFVVGCGGAAPEPIGSPNGATAEPDDGPATPDDEG